MHLSSSSPRSRSGIAALAILVAGGALAGMHAGCSGNVETASSGAGGASSSSAASAASSESASSSSASSSSAASSSSSGSGQGGAGGGGGAWPTCDAQPAGVPQKSLHEIWQDNPAKATTVWVPGVFVTAVSKAGCQAGAACQIFVQQAEQFADLAAGSQQALRFLVAANAAAHFVGIKVGDKVDVLAHARRDAAHNELLLEVSNALQGCAKAVGSGNPQPVTVTLADLTPSAYEDTVGPLLVKVSTVSGKPQAPNETFGLWSTGVFMDGGVDTVVSLSPSFLPNAAFVGLAQGKVHDFGSVTGVFGVFYAPVMPLVKYKEIYPRSMAEVPVIKVH